MTRALDRTHKAFFVFRAIGDTPTGGTDFAQVAVLGARAALAVGNNSGATHLMAAAGAPTIALFSKAADPDVSGPRGYVAILTARQARDIPLQQVSETALVLARSA